MCGATGAQTQLQNEQMQFYSTLTSEYSTVFGEDQNILSSLTKTFQPILAAGPNQEGFSAAEKHSLDSQAIEGTATNYRAAEKALREDQAAEGGNTVSVSGEDAQQRAQLAEAGAAQESGEEQQILQADYEQGRENFDNAAHELGSTASLLNPEGMAGQTTGAGSAAATTANEIAMENNSVWSSALSALGGVAGAAAGNINYTPKSGWSYGG